MRIIVDANFRILLDWCIPGNEPWHTGLEIAMRDYLKIKNDVNGNGRLVVHFLECLTDKQRNDYQTYAISQKYALAINQMKRIGGKKFHNKQFGGGIVFQCSSEQLLDKYISECLVSVS